MKKAISIFVLIFVPIFCFAQTIENIDYISTFNEGLAAIKKDGKWTFINSEGKIVMDYRDDLVLTNTEHGKYPLFSDGRCLIVTEKEGISYFGYIDKNGNSVIEPQFLNALNYNNGTAIVLKLVKESAGKNELLGKNIVYYKYFEVTIDIVGNVIDYLTPKGTNITLDKEYLRNPPKITFKQISNTLYVVLNKNDTWTIVNFKQ